jgi:hypothetical protein
MRWLMLLGLLSSSACAAEMKLNGPEISAGLGDVSLYAGDAIEQIFQKGGQTVYIDHGSASQGLWKVQSDQYCSQWPPSQSWACYDVMQDGDAITFVSGSGTRFEMRKTK